MAHGIEEVVNGHTNTMKMVQINQQTSNQQAVQQTVSQRKNVGVMGSRRIFAAAFKLKVLDSYRNDIDCRGNQRATARKYGIHRRQIQKWLQCEDNLRSSCAENNATTTVTSTGCCEVPIGGSTGVSISPGLIVGSSIDVTSKVDSITSSSSLINNNTRSPIVNCNVIASIGITTSSGTPIPAPAIVGTAVTAAAPALNLSLARLHGDEQQQQHHRQAAPPPHHPSVPSGTPMRHSIRRASSPLQYLQHNNNNNNHHQVPSSSSAPLRGMQLTYENTKRQQEMLLQQQNHHQQQSHHQRHSKRQHNDNNHQMTERLLQDNSCTPEIKYSYVMPRSNYENNDIFTGTSLSHFTKTDDYYQTLESYHKNIGYVSNNNNVKEIGKIDETTFSSYRDKNLNETGNKASLQYQQTTTSFASCSASTLLLVNHHQATTIKSERASPDSLATQPGPFETPGSPESAATMPSPRNQNDQHQHQHHHHHHRSSNQLPSRVTLVSTDTRDTGNNMNVCNNTSHENVVVVANTATGSAVTATAAIATTASAVHSNETTRLAHVHIGVNSHTCDSRVSEKRRGRRRQEDEREPEQRDNIKIEYDEQIRGMRVKEEISENDEIENTVAIATGSSSPIASGMTTTTMMMMVRMNDEPKREITDDELHIEDSRYHRESTIMPIIATCPDYQSSARTSNGLSSVNSSVSSSPIIRHTAETYSSLSSPRTASSSGISTSSSCSDSEIDPLDYSSNSARNVINDLSRRRSFSLRFKLDVLDAFHSDIAVAGNQRATARKFGINRRQVQKWLGQESELRGEIALRGGDLRQRLGPIPEPNNNSGSSDASLAVDLRTSSSTILTSISGMKSDAELENNNNSSSSPLYCCDIDSSSQRFGYYDSRRGSLIVESPEIQSRACSLSCCQESINGTSMMCYQETPNHRRSSSGYPESQDSLYCYSPRETSENEAIDVTISVSTLKRSACTLNCCYEPSSPKRICIESLDKPSARSSPISQEQSPPQDVPLCLVKPKSIYVALPMQHEPVTSTVPTPPAAQHQISQPVVNTTTNKKDAILFKPYLDNPVSKPNEDKHVNLHNKHGGLSPLSVNSVIVNNNNCHDICNMNEERGISQQTDYALELSLRVPVSWGIQHGGYGEFPDGMRSAFVRYPTSPHYT